MIDPILSLFDGAPRAGGWGSAHPHWRGYRVVPERIEFRRPGDHRLNERDCYERTDGGGWRRYLLNP